MSFLSGIFGTADDTGKNKFVSKGYEEDPLAFEYGGEYGRGAAEQDRYATMGRGYGDVGAGYDARGAAGQGRMGVTMDPAHMGQSRDAQVGALQLQRAAAEGNAPSAALVQQNMGLQQARAAQQSMAASARGGALAQASANRQAMNNAATMQAGGVQQAALLRAQEMENARAGYMGGSSALRGSDFQQAQYGAHLQDSQRGRNDAYENAMAGHRMGMTNAQLHAEGMRQASFQDANKMRMGRQALRAGEHGRVEGLNSGIQAANAANDRANKKDLWDGVSDLFGTGAKAVTGGMSGGATAVGT